MEKLNFLCGKWKMKRLAPCNLTNMSPRRGEGGGGGSKAITPSVHGHTEN